ncbi:MAG: RHS repeat-associated core domain-containing protein, partial [Planctomycetota bacterium]
YVDARGYERLADYRFDTLLSRSEEWISADGSQTREHLYQWTPGGRLSRIVDDRQGAVDYLYNDLGWAHQEVAADGSTWEYTYTDDGELNTLRDPSGIFITYERSALGVLTGRLIRMGVSGPVLDHETYSYTPVGFLKRIENQQGYVAFEKDSTGAVLREEQDSPQWSVSYEYDGAGRVTRLQGPSGYRTYHYDGNYRIAEVRDESGASIARYTYLGPRHSVLSRVHGNDTALSVVFDGLGRVTQVRTDHPTQGVIAEFLYGLTEGGLVAYEQRTHEQGHGDVYRYDGLTRLREVVVGSDDPASESQDPGSTTWEWARLYELSGDSHRTQVATTPFGGTPDPVLYTTDPQRHYYTTVGGETRQHNPTGDLVAAGAREFTYDWADRLIEVKENGQIIATYTYDAIGRRQSKTVAGVTTRFIYAGPWVIEEYRNGVLEAVNDFGDGIDEVIRSRRVDHADIDGDQDTTELIEFYLHTNRIGSVTHLTDASGAVMESYHYSPYGIPTIHDRYGQVVSQSPTGNPFLFTGREYDQETGLYHYRYRTYDPQTGSFLQEDPLRFYAGINLFEYALSSPLNFTDPLGLLSLGEIGEAVLEFLQEVAPFLGQAALSTIPFLEEALDLLSAITGKDLTEWAEEGFEGAPGSLGFWARIKKAAWAAATLAGSAIGVAMKFEKLIDFLRNSNGAGGKIASAARKLARKLGLKGGCFVAGTLVLTCSGLLPIEELRAEDQVCGEIRAGTGESGAGVGNYAVEATFEHEVEAVVALTIEDESGHRDVLQGTPNHPIWSLGRECWVAMGELEVGEALSGTGGPVTVVARDLELGRFLVYNLLVHDAHSYRVGALGVLVHNGCPGNFSENAARIGARFGMDEEEVLKRIHKIKRKAKAKGKNVKVDVETGEVHMVGPSGEIGDSIGNILDDWH